MTKISPFRKAIVAFLATHDSSAIDSFSVGDWARQFHWLDRSGLALPLAARLFESDALSQLPASVFRALNIRLRDNEARMKSMLEQFGEIQNELATSRIEFCCLKGFSLIPEICGFIRERHQVDFDLLIDPCDTRRAVDAVKPLGYTQARDTGSGEIRLIRVWKKHLTADSWLYDMSEGPALEFHTRLWEPETNLVDFAIPNGCMNRIEMRTIAGIAVPRLSPAWQFVSLVLHIFRHLVDSWVRLLSLYEVSVFLHLHQCEHDLWKEVGEILASDTRLSSACALVVELVKREFRIKLPQSLDEFCRLYLTAESAFWCEEFSQSWLYADPPGTKLSLLMQKQFSESEDAWRAYLLQRLFPRKTPPSLSDDVSTEVRQDTSYRFDEAVYRIQRFGYHLACNWQYLCAAARWKRFMRLRSDLSLSDDGRTGHRCDVPATRFWQTK